jgi:hypothetical protein
MPRYYFDIRDGNGVSLDEEGMELRDMQAVQEEAARSLADMARDEVRSVKTPPRAATSGLKFGTTRARC